MARRTGLKKAIENRGEKTIDFLQARRRLIDERGTTSRGARSPLLEPLRKIIGAPDIHPLFDKFICNPDQCHDLIHNLIEHHGIEATPNEIYQALAHIGIERFGKEASEEYSPETWERAAELARAGARLAKAAGDWMSAEKLWLKLGERAAESGTPNPLLQKQAMFELACLLSERGETEGAIEFFLLCENLANEDRDVKALARIRNFLGRAHLEQNSPEKALEYFNLSAEWAAEGDEQTRAEAELGIGTALAALERIEESILHFEQSMTSAGLAGDTPTRVEAACRMARILSRLGHSDDAIKHLIAALRLAESIENIQTGVLLLYNLFETCRACGAWSGFLLELTAIQNRIHKNEQFQHLGPVLILSAKAHTERGLFHLALHNLEEAAYLFQSLEETDQLEKVRSTIEQIRTLIKKTEPD